MKKNTFTALFVCIACAICLTIGMLPVNAQTVEGEQVTDETVTEPQNQDSAPTIDLNAYFDEFIKDKAVEEWTEENFNNFLVTKCGTFEKYTEVTEAIMTEYGTISEFLSVKTAEKNPDAPVEDDEVVDMEYLKQKFIEQLKEKYGEDYQFVYDGIIAKWGSLEAYLTEFGANVLPKEYQAGWNKFIGWLNEYAPIWATILACGCVVFIALFGRKVFNTVIDKIVDKRLTPIAKELNKQSNAMIAQNQAIQSIVPKTEKGEEIKSELKSAEKELKEQ